VAAIRARLRAAVGYDSGEGYVRLLNRIEPGISCDIVRAADGPVALPGGTALGDYDGAVMTGSALNVYDGGASILRQIDLARAVFAAGVPFFGSCWGLQIAVTAAGGRVEANVRGREFGYARRIVLTSAGRQHAVYEGKPTVFEAPTIHKDCVTQLPAGATVLAENEMGIQAVAFTTGRAPIVGVQYHPEYDHCDIAAAARRYSPALVTDGLFRDAEDLEAYAADVDRLHAQPADRVLAYRHGLGPAMTDERLRRLELANWLRVDVLKRAARHG